MTGRDGPESRLGLPPLALRVLLGGLITAAIVALIIAMAIGTAPNVPPSPVVGVVVAIDQVSLTQVNSFEMRTTDGRTVTLKVGALDNATQFSLSHLATHMATGVPIRAFYRVENGAPLVYHLEDAVPASASPAAT